MFENNLKYCREELQMTQKELGMIFGVTKNTVSGWENAHDSMPFNKLIKFCNLYNYSLDFVCGLTRKNTEYKKINTNKEKIGKKLKELRKELNLTQQELADICNFSQVTYSTYETGKFLINTITIYTICKTFNISIDYLVGRTKTKHYN